MPTDLTPIIRLFSDFLRALRDGGLVGDIALVVLGAFTSTIFLLHSTHCRLRNPENLGDENWTHFRRRITHAKREEIGTLHNKFQALVILNSAELIQFIWSIFRALSFLVPIAAIFVLSLIVSDHELVLELIANPHQVISYNKSIGLAEIVGDISIVYVYGAFFVAILGHLQRGIASAADDQLSK